MNFDNQGIVSGTFLRHRRVLPLVDGAIYFAEAYYGIHHFPSKILKLYKNKCSTDHEVLHFSVKGYKMFELVGHTFERRWIVLYSKGDNNYSISMTIFGYNLKLS